MFSGVAGKLKMLPLMSTLMKYGKINLKEYSQRFSDPFLKRALPTIQYDIDEVPTLVPMVFLSMLSVGDAGMANRRFSSAFTVALRNVTLDLEEKSTTTQK